MEQVKTRIFASLNDWLARCNFSASPAELERFLADNQPAVERFVVDPAEPCLLVCADSSLTKTFFSLDFGRLYSDSSDGQVFCLVLIKRLEDVLAPDLSFNSLFLQFSWNSSLSDIQKFLKAFVDPFFKQLNEENSHFKVVNPRRFRILPNIRKKLSEIDHFIVNLQQDFDIPDIRLALDPVFTAISNEHLTNNNNNKNVSFTPQFIANIVKNSHLTSSALECAQQWYTELNLLTQYAAFSTISSSLHHLSNAPDQFSKQERAITGITNNNLDHVSVDREINFWSTYQYAVEQSIVVLKGVPFILVVEILKHLKKDNITNLIDLLYKCRINIENVLKFLGSLSLYNFSGNVGFLPFNQFDTEFVNINQYILDFFGKLNNAIAEKAFQTENYYSVSNIIYLVHAVNKDFTKSIIRCIKNFATFNELPIKNFFMLQAGPLPSTKKNELDLLRNVKLVIHAWEDEFDKFHKVIRELAKARLDDSMKILWKISFAHRSLHERLESIKSIRQNHASLSRILLNVDAQKKRSLDGTYEQMFVTNIDNLDISAAGNALWSSNSAKYKQESDSCETFIANYLKMLLEKEKTLQNNSSMLLLCAKFNSLFNRPLIRNVVVEYQAVLLNHIYQRLDNISLVINRGYLVNKNGDCYLHSLYNVPGNIGLILFYQQLNSQLDKLHQHLIYVLGTDYELHIDGQRLKTSILQLKENVNCNKLFDKWVENFGGCNTFESLINSFCLILIADENKKKRRLAVNFDVNLLKLIKEARYLRALNFRLPLTILNATHQVSSIAHLVTRLVESVDVFNSCDSSYYTTHYRAAQDFVLNHFCRQGTTWDSYKVESFVFQFSDLMNKVSLLQQSVMMIEGDILLLIEKLKVCPFESVGGVLKKISLAMDSFLDADVCLQAKSTFVDSYMGKIMGAVYERNNCLLCMLLGLFGVEIKDLKNSKDMKEFEKKNYMLYIQNFIKNNRIKCRVMIGGKNNIMLQPNKNVMVHSINIFINTIFEVMNVSFVENFRELRFFGGVAFDKLISFELLKMVFKVFFAGYHDLMSIIGRLQVLVRFCVQMSNEEFYEKLQNDSENNLIELIENLDNVKKNFKFYKGEFVVNVVFFVDMVDFSTVVLNCIDEKIKYLKQKFKKFVEKKVEEFCVFHADLIAFVAIQDQKNSIECCIRTMDAEKVLNSFVRPLFGLIDEAAKYIELFNFDKISGMQKEFEREVAALSSKYVTSESKQQATEQIVGILNEVEVSLEEMKKSYEQNFSQKMASFVGAFENADAHPKKMNLDETLLEVLNNFEIKTNDLEKTVLKAHSDCATLKIESNSNTDNFNSFKQKIQANKNLFESVLFFDRKLAAFGLQPFQTANVDQLEVKLQKVHTNTQTHINKNTNEFKNTFINYTNQKYGKFKRTLAHVKSLNSACLMSKHFDLLQEQSRISQSKYTLKSNTCPIDAFLSVDILPETIGRIVQMAQGERSVHELINSIVESYRSRQIVVTLQNQVQVIKNFDEILTKIADHLSGLDSIRQSPYIAEFEQQINELENKLNELHLFFVGLMDLQRVWLYLDGLISNSDIQKLMPSLSADFVESSSGVITLIKKTANCPVFFDILRLFEGESVVESLTVSLSKIQNSLIDYLQQQRMACPRLYFMGDDDVLSLLGSCTDCRLFSSCVDKFLGKMFPAISRLHFADLEVVGIESKSGEKIMFDLIGGNFRFDKQSIQHFIINLDEFVKGFLTRLVCLIKREFDDILNNQNDEKIVEFVKRFPEQFICLTVNIYFSETLTESKLSIISIKNVYNNLSSFLKKVSSHFFSASDSSAVDSHKVNQICNVIIYILDKLTLFERFPEKKQLQFEKILRFYLNKSGLVEILINDCSFNYSYEYLGQYDRLVRTNLTDQCYDTLTQSLKCGMGGSPFGPAGTGKTESVKALGAELGRYVLVFNCDKNFDFYSIVRIITGLSSIGAWGCFDEFNRLETRMLSAVSQKLQSVQTQLRESKVRMRKAAQLNPNMAIFITMNPNYKGRSTLPQNLKKLFLSIAMSKPDRARIAHVILAGKTFFMEGVDLPHVSKNLVSFFMLCMDMLSKQVHYDWGLRALKAVLNSCLSQLDKLSSLSSDDFMGVLLNSLQWACIPKLNESDLSKFKYIFALMFDKYTAFRQLRFVDDRLDMLAHLWSIHHGIIISGPCYSGKSYVLDQYLARVFDKKSVRLHRIDPKSSSVTELYGHMNVNTREWTDGIFTSILRNIDEGLFHVIVFDGDVDPDWIENLNSVLDDNKLFTLVTGERLVIPENVKIIFETCNLENATLATISRCGLLNCDVLKNRDMDEIMRENNVTKILKILNSDESQVGDDAKIIASSPYVNRSEGVSRRASFSNLIRELLDSNVDILIYSSRATGKSKLLKSILRQQPQTKHIVLYVGVSTTPNQLISQLLNFASYKKIATGTTINCGGYKKCVIHIKFCNTPEYDDYNSQIILAFIRQMVAYRGFYRFSDGNWIDLSKFVCVFAVEISHSAALIRDIFIDRFIRHFFVIRHVCDAAAFSDIFVTNHQINMDLRRFSYEVEKFKTTNLDSFEEFVENKRGFSYGEQFEMNRQIKKKMHFLVASNRSNPEEILSRFADGLFVLNVHANYKLMTLKSDLVNVLNNLIVDAEKQFFVVVKQYEHLNSNQFDLIYNFMKGRVDGEYFANNNSYKNFIKEVNNAMESDDEAELPLKFVKKHLKKRVSVVFLFEGDLTNTNNNTNLLPSHITAELFAVTIPNLTDNEQIALVQKNLPESLLTKNRNLPHIIHDIKSTTNTLTFTNVVNKIFVDKKHSFDSSYNHLKKGINQIETSSFVVNQLKTELQEKQINLNQANKLANEKLTQMLIDQQKAEKQKNFSDELNEKLEVTKITVKSKKESVELKLSSVEPAVEEAKQAVSSINKRNLVELRSMNSPPGLVKLALESICVMLGEKVNLTEWKEVRSVILKEDFVNRILNYDADVSLNSSLLNKMKNVYLKNPDYTFEKVNRSSAACGPLVKWAIAQCTYYEMVLLIDPLRSELSELIKSQERNEVELEENRKKLEELTELIEKYKIEYSELIKKVNSITDELSVIQTKLNRSMMIIESLSSELVRWRQEMEGMESRQDSIIFLSVYASLSLFSGSSLATSFEAVERSFEKFDSGDLVDRSYANAIFEYLLGSETVEEYKSYLTFSDSQIVDNLSVLFYHMNELNNSILAIDPNNFCYDFLVSYYRENKSNKLIVCSFLDRNFEQVLENAVRFGNILLVKDAEFCTNNIVSLINEPTESFKNKNNMVIQKSAHFRIILLTSSKINAKSKDILSTIKVTTVNFSAGINTCSNMALDTYLNEFAVEMLQKKEELIRFKMESTIKINKLEKELLQTLNDEGNLLEDEKVLNKLTELKKETRIVNDQLEESEKFYGELQNKLSFYEDFQKIIGYIYHDVVCKLNAKDVLYNFTLSAYFDILKKTVIKYKSRNVNDVGAILNSFVKKLAIAVSASVFDKDRICFLLDLSSVLIKHDATRKNLQDEFNKIKEQLSKTNESEGFLKDVDEFVKKTLNIKLNKVYSSNLRKILDTSENKVSMIFFTSNMDPSINVEKIFPDIYSIAMGSNEGYEQFEAQLKKPNKVILLKNTHLCVEWLNYTLTKLTNINFKLICTFEVPLIYSLINDDNDLPFTIPNSNLLSRMTVVMFEAAPGLKAEMTRLFDTEMRTRMFSEKNIVKVPYYMAMARVHATIVERLRYCPIGWSTLLEFNEVDFKLACDIIDNVVVEGNDVEQDITRVSNMLANVLYGARIENKFDKNILSSILSVWFNKDKIFDYKIGSVEDLNEYFERLSEHTTPEEVGLDASSKNFITMNKINYLKRYIEFDDTHAVVEGVRKVRIDEKVIDEQARSSLVKRYEKLETSLGEAIIEAIRQNGTRSSYMRQFEAMKDISLELPVPINSQILLATKQVIVAKTNAMWQKSKLRVFANCEVKSVKYKEHFLIRKGMKSVGVRINADKVEISGEHENSMENVCLTWTEERLQDALEKGQQKVAIPVYTDRHRSELLTVFKFRTDADMDEIYQKGAAIFFD